MKCPKCGFENRPDARFCKQCGQPLQAPAAPPPAEQPCPRCGAINKPGARFCARCGAPLAPPAPSPAPPAAPPPPPSLTVPPSYVPPPEPEPARRAPRWLWIILPIALVLCLVIAGVLGYSAYRRENLPFLRPGPTPTAAPTATPAPATT
ncbi:MAG: zinc ribbon domain-containing protein, partial [Anaerolineae bacterium]